MDRRIYIIIFLAIAAIILTIIRESEATSIEPLSLSFSSKPDISEMHVNVISESILKHFHIDPKNTRKMKNSNDVRVLYPERFDILYFIGMLKDSLEEYNADVFSVENAKEKSFVVQIKNRDVIIKSFIFSKEPQAQKKGESPSVRKKPARR